MQERKTSEIEGEEGRKGEKEGEMKRNKRKSLRGEEGLNIKFHLYSLLRLFYHCHLSLEADLVSDRRFQLKLSEHMNNWRATFTDCVRLKQWSSMSAVHQQRARETLDADTLCVSSCSDVVRWVHAPKHRGQAFRTTRRNMIRKNLQ